jgi:phospholipid/cholesterol/gamma-HCH transport system permease protein
VVLHAARVSSRASDDGQEFATGLAERPEVDVVDANVSEAPRAEVVLTGTIGIDAVRRMREQLIAATRGPTSSLRIDLSGVESLDGGAAAVLVALENELGAGGIEVRLEGARGRVRTILRAFEARREAIPTKAPPKRRAVFEEVGRATARLGTAARDALAFVGEVVAESVAVLIRPQEIRWREVARVSEGVGANGLPVVALVSVLVGFIIAFQSAFELKQYGANILLADLVSLTITREMGPLMACLITVARSGSAFTAELGTMKVSEEIDALRAIGLSPIRFLVLPRIAAMVLVVPLLAVFADVVGVLGGLVVAVGSLELTPGAYLTECQSALVPRDLVLGVAKSVTFALAAALIACQRGLATRGGAAGVGRATTRAVVVMIIAVIVLDAVFAFFSSVFGL